MPDFDLVKTRESFFTRHITEELERALEGLSLIHQASRTLTHAEILALRSTPIEIVPATEILEYETAPTRLILPVSAIAISKKPTGARYENVGEGTLILVWGSDFSTLVATALELASVSSPVFAEDPFAAFSGTAIADAKEWQIPFVIAPAPFGGGGYQDNGLFVTLHNSEGNLTDGHPSNTIDVCCAFHVYDVPLKRYLTVQETGWDQVTRTFT